MSLPIAANSPSVDFVLNVFERTYRDLLQPGIIASRVARHSYPFAKIIVLVNNVDSRAEVNSFLTPLIANGEITAAYFVADRLAEALRETHLSLAKLHRTIHYTDCALVAIFLPGSPYMLYSDADVLLAEPHNWITPALQILQRDPRVAVVNPNWTPSTLQHEAREYAGDFALGYGFSDQLFLISRAEFRRPIYQDWAPVSWRYPLSHVTPIFEQRVDAYMRVNRRLRATYTKARYIHDADEGVSYRHMGFAAKWKRRFMYALMSLGELTPGRDPRYHT